MQLINKQSEATAEEEESHQTKNETAGGQEGQTDTDKRTKRQKGKLTEKELQAEGR